MIQFTGRKEEVVTANQDFPLDILISENTPDPMHVSVAGVAIVSLSLATVCLGEITRGHYVEIFSNTRDHVLVRTKRSSEVCKYKKGTWSECDKLVMVRLKHYYHDGTVINPAESRYTICGKDPCLTVGLVIVTTHTSPLSLISEPGAQAARPGGPTCQLVTRCISLAFSQPAQRSKHFSKLKLRNLIKLKSCPYFVKRIFMSRSQRNIWCSSDAPSKRIFCLADDKRGHAEGEKFWRFLW